MKLTFIRANHEVTGSCTMLEIGGHLGLIDCGMEQGKDVFENIPIPAAAGELEFVLVTHAHLDHTGLLPLLYKEGFRGAVYATQATCDLCDIMLKDSAHIQLSEAEYKSRKARRAGRPDVEPLYDLEDVEGLLKLLRPCPLYYIKQQLQSPVWRLCATLQRMLWIGSRPLPLDGFP